MAKILNVISAVTPMGGTIAKLRALMKSSRHQYFLYQPGYDSNRSDIEMEWPYYSTIGVQAYYGIHNRNIWKHVREIHRIIMKHQIEIVHFYFNFENVFAPFLRRLHPDLPMVRSIVGFDRELSFCRKALLSLGMAAVPQYVFISNYIKHLYEDTYPLLKKKQTRIIYNGAVHVRPSMVAPADRKILVTTSGLCERKNIKVLIEAMNLIRNHYHRHDVQLYVLGDGPERDMIERLIAEYDLQEQVILVGYTTSVAAYLDQCAVYVHPATTEGFGIAVIEAMEMHCPCIVADRGALPELVKDGLNGFVVPAYDAQIWAEKILCLLDDVPLRVAQAEASNQRATRHFSLNAFIDAHDRLYDELVS